MIGANNFVIPAKQNTKYIAKRNRKNNGKMIFERFSVTKILARVLLFAKEI
jgi:hypothetical protein